MIDYEYRGCDSPMTIDQLKTFANKGYELITIVYNHESGRYGHYFKRITSNEH